MELSNKILSDIVAYMKYAKWTPSKGRRESFEETVSRNLDMHISKFPELSRDILEAYNLVFDKKVFPSMRSMQFAGRPISLNNSRIYNCAFTPVNSIRVFSEIMFLLLGGTGVGYSVQRHHLTKLPPIMRPSGRRRYLVGDSIEGWSDAVRVLVRSYFEGRPLPEFDFRDIRPKGSLLITSGGRAPGPEPLERCLVEIRLILDRKKDGEQLTSLETHDIICHIAQAVLAGGIRRAALIALFDWDDDEMISCKHGAWWELNGQRARANNSAVAPRWSLTHSEFMKMWEKIQASRSGEPGILWTNDPDKNWGTNPCAEIALRPNQFCNLTTINASDISSQEDLHRRVWAATLIGTLQASYTNFHYLRDIWRRTTEQDALLGVSMTGIADGTVLDYDLTMAAQVAVETNQKYAKLLGINPAARVTTVKPEGTASLVAGTASGIHARKSEYYLRTVRVGKNEAIYRYLAAQMPDLVEQDKREAHLAVITIPQKSPVNSITEDESAIDMLERVKRVYNDWIMPGHRDGVNTHNVSATVSIRDNEWDEVGDWMWNNRNSYSGLAALPYDGGTYVQAPLQRTDAETYHKLMRSLTSIDLTKVVESEDNTNLAGEAACAGGNCEVI